MTLETIVRIAARGDGMTESGRSIPQGAPGDQVAIDGSLIEGPHHVAPACKHFPSCGGCQLQHIDDATYADYLVARVRDALTAQKITPPEIRTPHLSPAAARRRVTLHAVRQGKKVVIGYHQQGTHHLVDLKICPVMAPDLWALVGPIKQMLATALPPRASATVQLDRADQGVAVMLGKFAVEGLAATEALTDFAMRHKLARLAVDEGYGPELRWEPEPATVTFDGVAVSLPMSPFLQATSDGEAVLVKAVTDICHGAARVADLFAGIGTFALPLSRHAHVTAAEGARDALLSLQMAANRERRHLTAQHRDLFRNPLMQDELKDLDAVVIDPPRAGAQLQMAELANSTVPVIAAVSCNPATFARDARILMNGGYRIDWIQPVGQFRWSTHVELVAKISRG
jgi:23S rRNA (uracil1939-C5)-methyltransferase